MRASCQGRSAPRAVGLSARTPCAKPSDRPMAMPTASSKAFEDFLIIRSGSIRAEAIGRQPRLGGIELKGIAAAGIRAHAEYSDRLGVCLQPGLGIDRLSPLPYFEVKLRIDAVRIAQGGDHVSGRDPVPHGLVEHLGVTVQGHVTAAVADNH